MKNVRPLHDTDRVNEITHKSTLVGTHFSVNHWDICICPSNLLFDFSSFGLLLFRCTVVTTTYYTFSFLLPFHTTMPYLSCPLILAGDLNCHLSETDKYGPNYSQTKFANSLNTIIEQLNLMDIWRILNPEIKRFA